MSPHGEERKKAKSRGNREHENDNETRSVKIKK